MGEAADVEDFPPKKRQRSHSFATPGHCDDQDAQVSLDRHEDAMMEASEDEGDVGPMPAASGELEGGGGSVSAKKRRKRLPHEQLYLDRLPSSERYYRSFMHRDTVSWVTVTKTHFIVTASVDGHIKFWKKKGPKDGPGIEFVKHYRAHLAPILGVSASADGLLYASVAADASSGSKGSAKVFDVENFDMINMTKLSFSPSTCCWIHKIGQAASLLAISDQESSAIHAYDGRGVGTPVFTIDNLHRAPVHCLTYNPHYNCVLSADTAGMIEYWEPSPNCDLPPGLAWSMKSQTDLYEFRKSKSVPSSMIVSPAGTHFVTTTATPNDRHVRIFSFVTGKLLRKYDESLSAITEMQQAGTAAYRLDDMEFGRRLAVDRDLEKAVASHASPGLSGCAIFDETGNFVIYPSLLGIKVINFRTNKIARILGKDENFRFLQLSLFQGGSARPERTTLAMATSDNPLLAEKATRDPILFCTAYKRARFYFFNRLEPESEAGGKGSDRDIFNERPTREEQAVAAPSSTAKGSAGHSAIIHTTAGDIHCKLFPDLAPKTCENFAGHSRSGYYENIIFHRVIKKFMLQTGDPLGDGTGGESIWGGTFEDEITPRLRHDRPYCLSMANAGPRTNGSQFFITTVPTPWLDNKHTIFGRCTAGLDVIHDIENVRCDKNDKPLPDYEVRITSITVE